MINNSHNSSHFLTTMAGRRHILQETRILSSLSRLLSARRRCRLQAATHALGFAPFPHDAERRFHCNVGISTRPAWRFVCDCSCLSYTRTSPMDAVRKASGRLCRCATVQLKIGHTTISLSSLDGGDIFWIYFLNFDSPRCDCLIFAGRRESCSCGEADRLSLYHYLGGVTYCSLWRLDSILSLAVCWPLTRRRHSRERPTI